MLKEIVDETSHGKYDFMYLRIGKEKRNRKEYVPDRLTNVSF